MQPLRFAHMADLHLDTPFRGVANLPGTLRESLAEASLKAWDNAVAICLTEQVDFVLIAGDVYDQEEAGVRAQLRFLRGLRRLSEAGIPVFVVHGNHDPQGGRWSAIRAWPPGVTVFGHEEVEVVPVRRGGTTLALVHGLSYPERHVRENLAVRFRRRQEEVYQIGLLHASVGDHAEHGRYAPCSLEDLRRSGLDYWALGHIHTRETVHPAHPAVVYPGNLQARHPGEEGPRGLYIVEAALGSPPRLTFHAADEWRFATVRLDLGREPLTSVEEVSAYLLRQAIAAKGDRGLIVRGIVAGATALHADLNRRGRREELLQQLRDECEGVPGLFWDDLVVSTRPSFDRTERTKAGDFLADLLRFGEARGAWAAAEVRSLLDELGRVGDLAPLLGRIRWQAIERMSDELWEEALQLALDVLEEAGEAS